MTNINIIIKPIDYTLELKLADAVSIKGNYKKLNSKQLDKLKRYIIKKKLEIQIEDILSIRSAYMTMKIMKNSYRLKKSLKEIYKLYEKNTSIKIISKKYDLPPIPLIKSILNRKYSRDMVKVSFITKI